MLSSDVRARRSKPRSSPATHERFQKVPGIGKRTAERLVVELKDKVVPSGAPTVMRALAAPTSRSRWLATACSASATTLAEVDAMLASAAGESAEAIDLVGAAWSARSDGAADPMRISRATIAPRAAEDAIDRSLRPRRIDEFVGQQKVKDQLSIFIEAATQRGQPLDHVLFAGPPGPRQDLARADRRRRARRALRA